VEAAAEEGEYCHRSGGQMQLAHCTTASGPWARAATFCNMGEKVWSG